MTILVQQQLREATERLIDEGENCWPATVERFTELANPAAVLALLNEIERLSALAIERETVRIGQSLQRHDDQKQIDELVALGIQQDKDEIEQLKAENAELKSAKHTLECRFEVSEDTLSCIRGCLRAAEGDIDQLKAEKAVFEEGCRALAFQLSAGGYNAAELTAEQLIAKVQGGLDLFCESTSGWVQKVEAERDQLKAENAELRRDAERYRWLRKCSHFDMPQHRVYCGAYGPALDEDIDQAMTKEQP